MTSSCPSAAAHISAVCARRLSRASTVCPARQQRLDGTGAPRPGRQHQHGFAVRLLRVRIGARLEEEADDRGVAPGRGQGEWPHTVAVGHVHARAGPHERVGNLDVVSIGRPVERGRAVSLERIHVDAALQFEPYARNVATPRGVDEWSRRSHVDAARGHASAITSEDSREPARDRSLG